MEKIVEKSRNRTRWLELKLVGNSNLLTKETHTQTHLLKGRFAVHRQEEASRKRKQGADIDRLFEETTP